MLIPEAGEPDIVNPQGSLTKMGFQIPGYLGGLWGKAPCKAVRTSTHDSLWYVGISILGWRCISLLCDIRLSQGEESYQEDGVS